MAFEDLVAQVLDRTQSVDALVERMRSHWSTNLFSRRPASNAPDEAGLPAEDFDLACLLLALSERGAVVSLPVYASRRPSTTREGETVISPENRHGKILALVSNQKVFSFSVQLEDANVIVGNVDGESVGAARNFMVVDVNGDFHSGFGGILFNPTKEEIRLLQGMGIWDGSGATFRHFAHPNRWTSLYGRPYRLTKLLIARLAEEATFGRTEVKRLASHGEPRTSSGDFSSPSLGEHRVVQAIGFDAVVDPPTASHGVFVSYPDSQDGWKAAKERVRIIGLWLPALRFAARITEYAFHRFAAFDPEHILCPWWIRSMSWQSGFVPKRAQHSWHRLPMQDGSAIRWRAFEVTEEVSIDSLESGPGLMPRVSMFPAGPPR